MNADRFLSDAGMIACLNPNYCDNRAHGWGYPDSKARVEGKPVPLPWSLILMLCVLLGILSPAIAADVVSGAFFATGSLAAPRSYHTATLLGSGKVLATGDVLSTTSAELYDPVTGAWSTTSPLAFARSAHTATLLANGKVLVAGETYGDKITTNRPISSSELYDPEATGVSNDDLFAAVNSGNAPEVRRLLAAGADANGRDDQGATPLLLAALSGSTEIAELLIASGADLNAKDDKDGKAPLHAAVYRDRIEVARLLVRKGADVNAKSTFGWTPLYTAMQRLFDLEMTQQVSPSDMTAAVSIVELLLANGADVNARGPEDIPPLYNAAKPEIAELLIVHGAEVDARTNRGYTPLRGAAYQGNKDIAEVLIAHGADVDAKGIDGATPLLWALRMAFAASPSGQAALSDERSLSPVEQWKMQDEIRKMKKQWSEVAKLLIAHGADVNVNIKNIETPLGHAANLGYKDVVEALIAKGANVNGGAAADETPLHAAIAEMHRDVAELLIKNGANVNARNMRSQRTPLHFLAKFIDDRKLAELMIEHGADVNAKDKNGETPLTFATRSRNYQVADVLKRKHAK